MNKERLEMQKRSIKSLNISDLEKFVTEYNQPKFRSVQIIEWLYKKQINEFQSMTNLPKNFINVLESNFVIEDINAKQIQKSVDGTTKYLLELYKTLNQNKQINFTETVAIPSLKKSSARLTLCISSQAGCAMNCKFCATGQQGFTRNLTMGEILEQALFVINNLNIQPSNIVVMGQGEPLLNFENVFDALSILNNEKFFNIGARKITISTCGIIPGIEKLSNINKQYGLAISLHSAIQSKRDNLMPRVNKYNLISLKEALINYINKTNRRITFEYLMINNFNDSNEDLEALIKYCNGVHCHINLIKLNHVLNSHFKASKDNQIKIWLDALNSNGIESTLRSSRGSDIDAACGQLLHKNK